MDSTVASAEKHAICTADSYSYTGNKDTCSTSNYTVGLAQGNVTDFKVVTINSVKVLMTAMVLPAVPIGFETDGVSFLLYSDCVMQFWCSTNLDHAVLAVGYGSETTYGEMFIGFIGDSTRSEFFKGHVDFIYSLLSVESGQVC